MRKKEKFDASSEKLASLTKAIGHPARIEILIFLMEEGPATCQNIVDKLPYSQSTVSGHLQKLKEVGFIKLKLHKTSSIYSFDKERMVELNKLVQHQFRLIPEKKQLSLF
jgi:ArsR family transcriptional regulator, arsenate/arsenite/antimonite-responsive transcriptional repressor